MTEMSVRYDNVPGNFYDKYNTRNPIARYLMNGFLGSFDELTEKTNTRVLIRDRLWRGQSVDAPTRPRMGSPWERSRGNKRQTSQPKMRRPGSCTQVPKRSLFDLKPNEASADLVICCEVLEHVPERNAL